ncbi:MAG: choice-of-anchor D domain-containing protein, partial [Kiritimatiellae bacterium]|nr:choice-of-anchor D domain-containing protein [Kiritimatiellia bacterium]
MLSFSVGARADHYWDGGGSGDSWHTANNWNPNSVPVSTTLTHVAGAGVGTAQVVAAGAVCRTLEVGDGTAGSNWKLHVTTGGVLTIGNTLTCGTNGTVLISTGTLAAGTVTLNGGTINLSGGTLSCSNFTATVGVFTNPGGRLVVSNGTFTPKSHFRLTGPGSPELILDGATAAFDGNLTIGFYETGRVSILRGAQMSAYIYAGYGAGSHGYVTVTGSGTVLNAGALVGVVNGTGHLYVLDGATLLGDLSLGGFSDLSPGMGYVTVDGADTVVVSQWLDVGGYAGQAKAGGVMWIMNGTVIVSNKLSVWSDDSLQLHGGTLTAPNMEVDPGGSFIINGGVLEPGNYKGRLTANGGTVAPGGLGTPGMMTVSSNFWLLNTSAILAMEIGGTNKGSQYDHVTVSNEVLWWGILDVSFCNGYIPDPGAVFDLFDWGTRLDDSEFGTTNLPALPPARWWDTSMLYSNGTLAITQGLDTCVMLAQGLRAGLFWEGISSGDTTPSTDDGSDFGAVQVSGFKTNQFRVLNPGSTNVNVYGMTVSGPGAADFSIEGMTFPAGIPGGMGASSNFTITFNPSVSGLRTATVIITNDGIGQNPYTFVVQGRGSALPSVETAPITNLAPEYAECGGTVTSDGGLTVGLRGCCWNTSGSPTLADDHTEDGSGTGAFVSTLTNLTGGGTYYVRAYATNELGISYGEDRTFVAPMTPPGKLLDFDGTNDMVDLGSNIVLALTNGAFTIEAWIKPTTKASICTILGRKSTGSELPGYALFFNTWNTTDRRLIFETLNGSVKTTDPVITFDVWQHVAVTWDGANLLLYVNGDSKPASGSVDMADGSQHATIGSFPVNAFYMDGQLDEMRIWNAARSESDLRDNMHRQLSGTETGLLAYYDCNVLSGTTLPDLTTNDLDGTLTGPAWASSTIPCAVEIEDDPDLRGVWLARTNSLSSSILSVSNAAVTGLNFRVFGHNGDALTNDTPDKPAATMWRLNRAWQFEGGGAVIGDLRIDCSSIAGLITDTDHLRLLM